jgi:ATP-dependent RNA helicase DeaD
MSPAKSEDPHRPQRTGKVRLYIAAGHDAGLISDLVGAIIGEARVAPYLVGRVQIHDGFSTVEVPSELADTIVTALEGRLIRGHRVRVRRDRGPRGS